MKTQIEMAQQQLDLHNLVREELGINIVTCGGCGSTLLHTLEAECVECPDCHEEKDFCDCPDIYYDGMRLEPLFSEGTGYTFESSVGSVTCNAEGKLLGFNRTVPKGWEFWLEDIARIDMEDYHNFCKHLKPGVIVDDILAVGYWDKEGIHHQPDYAFRNEIYLGI